MRSPSLPPSASSAAMPSAHRQHRHASHTEEYLTILEICIFRSSLQHCKAVRGNDPAFKTCWDAMNSQVSKSCTHQAPHAHLAHSSLQYGKARYCVNSLAGNSMPGYWPSKWSLGHAAKHPRPHHPFHAFKPRPYRSHYMHALLSYVQLPELQRNLTSTPPCFHWSTLRKFTCIRAIPGPVIVSPALYITQYMPSNAQHHA